MELIYIWINGYKNLFNVSIDLNSKYSCDFKDYKCSIKDRKNYNIFGDYNFLTIVGSNGSGKTNVTEALAAILKHKEYKEEGDYADFDIPKEYLLIYKVNEKFKFKTSFKNTIEFIYNNKKIEPEKSKEKYYPAVFKPFLKKDDDEILEFPIYLHEEEIVNKKIRNYFYYDRFRFYDTTHSLLKLLSQNKEKNFKFIEENENLKFDSYGFELDIKKIFIWLNYHIKNFVHVYFKPSEWKNRDLWNFTDTLISTNNFSIGFSPKDDNEFYDSFYNVVLPKAAFMYTLIQVANLHARLEGNENIIPLTIFQKYSIYLPLKDHGKLKEFYEKIKSKLESAYKDSEIKKHLDIGDFYNTTITYLNTYIKLEDALAHGRMPFKNLLKHYDYNLVRLNKDSLIEINKEIPKNSVNEKLSNLGFFRINFYKNCEDENVYTYFELSTGEQRILRTFADMLYTLDQEVLIFDEADISWHPMWQRKMIYYIKDILDKQKIQKLNIIFCTHSPFILSDMPRENIIMLNRDSENKCIVVKDSIKTFGGNIHTLFAHPFFLPSTMGAFAQEKIKCAAKLLKTKNNNYKEADDIISLINEDNIFFNILTSMKISYSFRGKDEENR